MYGGIDNKSNILDTTDIFDCCTYKFVHLKYRLDYKPQGRQGASAVTLDKYTIVFIGVTFTDDFVRP